MPSLILKPLAYLSLRALHRLGEALGALLFYCMPSAKKRVIENITQSQLAKTPEQVQKITRQSFTELGKAIFETPAIWQKKEAELLPMVRQVYGWDVCDAALNRGKGIIFLTPHLGCFEITSICYGTRYPVTVLYRPPKINALEQLMLKGRARTGVSLAEANAGGVRKLMQALKKGEAIGILPDQIPAAGEGEWADFFGKPAYTMTLASKLAEKTGATVIIAFGERLANGAGYDVYFTATQDGAINTPALLNKTIEQQIAQKPSQYLWSYNRYKVRNHAVKKQAQISED
jgi:Kdo2-lipid IVA lauroyltransferase/acyltransferase